MQIKGKSLEGTESEKTSSERLLITHRKGLGEEEMANRVALVAKGMGIDAHVVTERPSNGFVRHFFPNLTRFIAKQYRPTLIISLQGGQIDYKGAKKLMALTHGSDYYFGSSAVQPINTLSNFDAFLVGFPDKERLTKYFCGDRCSKKLSWYTTCPKTPYRPVKQFRLFYCGSNWSTTSFGRKYEKLFSRLDATGYLDIYGKKNQWRHAPKSYRKFIKADGESIIQIMHETGVALVLHAPDHFEGRVPTARIFEAAAASNVIISDRHPFILENFKDSVLYIDTTKTSEEIFDQIDERMKWIQANPEKALKLAKRAHKIFAQNFTLESQLEKVLSVYGSYREDQE